MIYRTRVRIEPQEGDAFWFVYTFRARAGMAAADQQRALERITGILESRYEGARVFVSPDFWEV